MSEEQGTLFDLDPFDWWRDSWEGMPEFESADDSAFDSITVRFRNEEDRRAFLLRVGENPARRRSIWYPLKKCQSWSERNAPPTVVEPGKYPIYVISKGRWETSQRLTVKSLEQLGIAYHVVVEPQEFDAYAAVIEPSKILVLPFSNLGQGSIPARNWVWEHSLAQGAHRHWILDDNLAGFYRLNRNIKTKMTDANPFVPIERFVDRYKNIGMAGHNYECFAPALERLPPYRMNTRIYSSILISNDLPYRWRGRYNEDTDLSLRVLKGGLCTVLFNAFLANKMPTMTMAGGNTDELYADDGRLAMAQSLADQHPDVARVSEKWGRYQHQVDYRSFRTQLESIVMATCHTPSEGKTP